MKTLVHTDKELIEATIKKCDICYVGLADTDGTPYVLPMNFGYRDGVIYLHSAQEGRSISILERNPRVCITFSTDHDHFEEDFDKKTEALDIIMKQYSDKEFRYSDPAVKNVKIWIVEMDEVTCKEFGAPHNKLKIGS